MTWKIEKRSYSSNPWRLIDETGREVYSDVTFDHPDLGKSRVSMPVCGPTKQSIVDQVLGGFVTMRSLLKMRTVALKTIQGWAACGQLSIENVTYVCIDALSYAADETNQKEVE